MFQIKRSPENPLLSPERENAWEAEAAFNPSVIKKGTTYHAFFRALSRLRTQAQARLEVSTIGHATSKDGVNFGPHDQFLAPSEEWERFGCEDPRVCEFEGKYYIFYTALSEYPFAAPGIRVGVAITSDLKTIEEKHLVTPFNAKAMALFPERIGGKIVAVLTANTDMPPAKIAIATFDKIEDLWSSEYWIQWYTDIDSHVIHFDANEKDHIEFGAAPLKTEKGWLILYSYIYNYFSPPATFGIQAALLDAEDPRKVISAVKRPFLIPEEEYELYGKVPRIVFPTGSLIKGKKVYLYYGAADTTSCLATFDLADILEQLVFTSRRQLVRFEGNPIISPIGEHKWEAFGTFNPAAVYLDGKVHILYRAMSHDNTSVVGYASSVDGVDISERLTDPIYVPRAGFESKTVPGGNSGCEDPRVTLIGDTLYMCYTAFDGKDPPRVALTSISTWDFLQRQWNWRQPVLISPPGADDKDAAIFPRKVGGKYLILHRLGSEIWLDSTDSLEFDGTRFLGGRILMSPRETAWDSKRIGIAGPPIETEHGWLLLYHGISRRTNHYNVRAALLDREDPFKILYRTHDSILDPKMPYEKNGIVSNVVFPCGSVIMNGELFVYYGGADKVVGVATIRLDDLVHTLAHEARYHPLKKSVSEEEISDIK